MFHFWKSAKVYAQRATVMDFGLLKICLCALGIVLGVTVPRKRKCRQAFWPAVCLWPPACR